MAIPTETDKGVVASVNIYKAVVEVGDDHARGLTTPKEAVRLMDQALSKRKGILSIASNNTNNLVSN